MNKDRLQRIAVCPGSFDPITEGHMDVIRRASEMFGKVYVAIAEDPGKVPLFSVAERIQMAGEACADLANVEVDSLPGLVVEYAQQQGAVALVKGLRAVSDFEWEFQMALMNRELAPDCETIFLMPSPKYSFVSSTMICQVARLRGNILPFVPAPIAEEIVRKLGGER